MDAWSIASACLLLGMTQAEANLVQQVIAARIPDPTTLTAGRALRALQLAINLVLARTREVAAFYPEEKP